MHSKRENNGQEKQEERKQKPEASNFHALMSRHFHGPIYFLEWFWLQIWISFKFHKPAGKTYRPKNDVFLSFDNCLVFLFDILYFKCAHRNGQVEILQCGKKWTGP